MPQTTFSPKTALIKMPVINKANFDYATKDQGDECSFCENDNKEGREESVTIRMS